MNPVFTNVFYITPLEHSGWGEMYVDISHDTD